MKTWSGSQKTTRPRGAAHRLSCWALVLTLVSCVDFHPPTSPPGAPPETTAANATTATTVVLVGAGDIAVCSASRDEATATLLDNIPGTVFTAGDNAYPDGSATDFSQCYEPSWGRHKARTMPSPGNHDYHIAGASDYFAYYGANAGPAGRGYYSYDIGDWHVVSLNSNIDRTATSPQATWLRADLAASTKQCTVAYWHHARFSSGIAHGSNASMQPLWQALYDAGAEIVISGHEHNYERFAPQTATGMADPAMGIREFVVGTGGASPYTTFTPLPNSEVRDGTTSGVLKLTLDAGTYSWQFIPIAGQTFTDAGTGACHGPPGGGGVSASQSTVTASPMSITAGGGSSTITVTTKDALGNPISGATVILAATGSGNTLTQPTDTTNASGVATGTLASTVAELKIVSATINGTAITQTAPVTVTPPGSGGTITHALLTSGNNAVNQRIYTTASITPAPNALITVAVLNHRSPSAISPVLSGGGMTSWSQVASVDFHPISLPLKRLTVFRAMSPTPGSGPITITFTNSVANVQWVVSQWSGVETSGTNGAGAIGQTGSNRSDASSGLAVSLTPFGNPNNVAYGAVGVNKSVPTITPGASFTKIDEQPSAEGTAADLLAEWAVNRNTVDASWTGSLKAGLLAIEIQASGAGGGGVSASQSSVAASTPITAGSGTSNITVTARDASGSPVSGANVVLAATGSGNTLSGGGITDGSGVATGTLSSTVAGDKIVSATISNVAITQTATVTVNPLGPSVSPSLSTVVADPSSFTAGGSSTITVTVNDGSGAPMSGVDVTLSATGSGNNVTQPSPTDIGGQTTGTLTSTGADSKTVTAVAGGVTLNQQPVVTVVAGPPDATQSTVSASPTSIVQTTGTSTITVTVKDANGNPVNGSAVLLGASGTGNSFGQPGLTNLSGVTTGTLSSTDLQTESVTATAGGVLLGQQPAVTITPPVPTVSPALSTVGASPTSFTAGGSSTITVTVKDGSDAPMSGIPVTLSATGSGNNITQPSATDVNGQTTGTVTSTGAGSKTVTAVAGGVTLNQQPVVMVAAGSPDAGQSTVAAAPTSITAGSTSTITVTVKDAFGNPVGNSAVALAAPGTNVSLGNPAGPANPNGVFTSSLSSTDPQTVNVSATAALVPITQTATVTVTPPGSGGTITQTLLTAGNNPANLRVYTTASISPAPNTLVTVAVLNHQGTAAAPSPVLTGGGMAAWEVVGSVTFFGTTPLKRLTLYRALSAAPGSGPITMTSSVTVANCQWIVSQWGGVDVSGANGAGAIGQTGSTMGTAVSGLTVSLAAFASANNVALGLFGIGSSSAIATAGSGFTTIAQQPSAEGTTGDLFAEWAVNRTTINATWTTKDAGALGVEIRARISP